MVKTLSELRRMYDEVSPFYEELARVRKDGRWFHIHPDGSRAYEETYDHVYSFSGGRAKVRIGDTEFFINCHGKKVA